MDGELQEFVELTDIPAIKFTSYDGQQFYFSSNRAVCELKSMDRTLLDFYDYIFVAKESQSGYTLELQQFTQRVFSRILMWAGHDFCPRVAVLGCACDNVKELVPENTSIIYV